MHQILVAERPGYLSGRRGEGLRREKNACMLEWGMNGNLHQSKIDWLYDNAYHIYPKELKAGSTVEVRNCLILESIRYLVKQMFIIN